MRRLALVVVLLPLAGCAELTNALAPPYVPQPIHVYDAVQHLVEVMTNAEHLAERFAVRNPVT